MHLIFITKKQARIKAKDFRKSLCREIKQEKELKILNNLINLDCYKEAKTLFVYVSKSSEIDTFGVIENALKQGKRVAVPKCLSGTKMQFRYITSAAQLKEGSFGIMEPMDNLPLADITECSLMVVPALAADIFGYRVGYGKGYYDRYLNGSKAKTVMLCYESDFYFKVLHNKYDYRCSYVITENKVRKTKGDNNG